MTKVKHAVVATTTVAISTPSTMGTTTPQDKEGETFINLDSQRRLIIKEEGISFKIPEGFIVNKIQDEKNTSYEIKFHTSTKNAIAIVPGIYITIKKNPSKLSVKKFYDGVNDLDEFSGNKVEHIVLKKINAYKIESNGYAGGALTVIIDDTDRFIELDDPLWSYQAENSSGKSIFNQIVESFSKDTTSIYADNSLKNETINGITVPPEPDPKVNNATLAGVDVNGNGVRDDVERKIVQILIDPQKISYALIYAKSYERELYSTTTSRKELLTLHSETQCAAEKDEAAMNTLKLADIVLNNDIRLKTQMRRSTILQSVGPEEVSPCGQ